MDDVKTLSFYAPIEKTDEEKRMVYGYASTEALDSQGEIVKKDALKSAIDDYMRFANIREMHQPSAVGKTKQAQIDSKGLYIAVKVIDDNAWKKVKEGVYNGFSIGGRVKQMVDNEITDLTLAEISLVDRPANPEAIFDVFKADLTPKKEIKKDIYGADYLVDLACNIAMFIEAEKYKKEDTADLERALKSVKSAIVDELKEPEYYESMGMMSIDEAVEYAERVTNLTKVEEEKVEDTEKEEVKEEVVEPKVEEVTLETVPVEEKVEEPKPEITEDSKETEEVTDPDKVEEEPVKEEEKSDEAIDIVKVVNQQIDAGKMPSDDQIDLLLKAQDLPVNQQTKDFMRFEIAGLIIKAVQAQMDKTDEAEAAKMEAKKVLNEADVVVANNNQERGQFHRILELISKAEGQIERLTPQEIEVPPPAPNAEMSTQNSNVTEALAMLQQAVAILSAAGSKVGGPNAGAGVLTPDQEDALRNGDDGENNSELTSRNQMSTNPVNGEIEGKAARTTDLAKVETLQKQISSLQDEVKKLSDTPMPIKAKASYSTIEKNNTIDPKSELAKATKRADELHNLMKESPDNLEYQAEAHVLSAQIMKLRREANG